MGKARAITPLEVRVLSELRHCRKHGTSPTDLARRGGLSRASLYVLLRRLAKRRFVSRRRDHGAEGNQLRVFYTITAAGLKAREVFARAVGLRP